VIYATKFLALNFQKEITTVWVPNFSTAVHDIFELKRIILNGTDVNSKISEQVGLKEERYIHGMEA